jgi:hypothetical protein
MSNDDVNRVAGIFQNAEMATQLVPVMDEQGRPTGKAKLELLEDYGPRKKGSTLITVSYSTTPAVGLAPVEIYRSESKMETPAGESILVHLSLKLSTNLSEQQVKLV